MNKYRSMVQEQSRFADERAVATLVGCKIQPRIVLATLPMAEDLPELLAATTHVLIDEAGQATLTGVVSTLVYMKALEKVLITGDPKQLQVYTAGCPEGASVALTSVLRYCINAPAVGRGLNSLNICYRCHPALVTCLAAAAYPDGLDCGVTELDRSILTRSSINLPVQQVPLVLLHTPALDERAESSFSRFNTEQTNIASAIIINLESSLPLEASIIVICLYSENAHNLQQTPFTRTHVYTVDSYQSQEADVVILITTRSMEAAAYDDEKALAFVTNDERVTVALSRARNGLFIIGNIRTLMIGQVWRRYIDTASRLFGVPIVNSDYLDLMNGQVSRTTSSPFTILNKIGKIPYAADKF